MIYNKIPKKHKQSCYLCNNKSDQGRVLSVQKIYAVAICSACLSEIKKTWEK